jgi:hypothetical protein
MLIEWHGSLMLFSHSCIKLDAVRDKRLGEILLSEGQAIWSKVPLKCFSIIISELRCSLVPYVSNVAWNLLP